MRFNYRYVRIGFIVLAAILLPVGIGMIVNGASSAAGGSYKVLAWNDLGMHCYNQDFSDLAVLPPYNTLWVQVVKSGDPPTLVTSGITVEYSYPDNTYSVGKTNFWDYDQALFGVDLPPNVGLKGKGLSGKMDLAGDHFVAEGIPITEFSDSAPTVRQPYQLANVVVKNASTGAVLTSTQVVTPTSSEMRCDRCHSDTGMAKPNKPTGKVETNILQLHDEEENTNLMANRPVLCANCHGSNALGMAGNPSLKNLSNIMHEKHAPYIANNLDGCYNCHPGPQTKCLRDVMSTDEGMNCVNCHGGMQKVSTNPDPWLNEPRCDTCHDSGRFDQNHPLFRFSTGHGGLYCEACHDSTHAIAPSREANDAIKFKLLQGKNGPLEECSVCHTNSPDELKGPHARSASTSPGAKPTFISQAANDGWILETSETSNRGGTKNNRSKVFYVGDNNDNKQYRGILSFDTSGIPDGAVISMVTLKVKKAGLVGTDPFRSHKGLRVDISDSGFSGSLLLQSSDFQADASKVLVGQFSSKLVSGWYTANLGSAAYPYINTTGTTQFRLRFYKDDNNDGGADYFKFYSGNADAASRPQLIVEYTIP